MNQFEIDYQQGYDACNNKWLDILDKIREEMGSFKFEKPLSENVCVNEKITTSELKQILQDIKDDCQKRKVCTKCKFDLYNEGCLLNHIPDEWNLDKMNLFESEVRE